MVKKMLLLMIACLSVGLVQANVAKDAPKETEALCGDKKSCEDVDNKSCKCWCAYKPGPREKVSPKDNAKKHDNPKFRKLKHNKEAKCYCAPRDIEKETKDVAQAKKEAKAQAREARKATRKTKKEARKHRPEEEVIIVEEVV